MRKEEKKDAVPECFHCRNFKGCKLIKNHKHPCLNFEERKKEGE